MMLGNGSHLCLAGLLASTACSSGVAVSTTTTSHKRPDYAAAAPRQAVYDTAGVAAIPKSRNNNERVAFVREGSIWIMKPDGTDAFRLTMRVPESPDKHPAMSPRGDMVVFSSRRDGHWRIYVAGLDGSGMRPVTDGNNGSDMQPAWSPDGRSLVFVRESSVGRRDLYIQDIAEGSKAAELLRGKDNNPEHAGSPSWSPDGKHIAFAADRAQDFGTGLWLLDIATNKLVRLTRPSGALTWVRDVRPSFSPDGRSLVFASNRHSTSEDDAADFDIYTVSLAGKPIRRLTRDPAVANDPCFSPDGKRIFFTSTRSPVRPYAIEIYVISSRGSKQKRITRDEIPQNSAPSAGILAADTAP